VQESIANACAFRTVKGKLMRNKVYCVTTGVLGVLITVSGVILAESKPPEGAVQIRKTQEQVVLYTIHRGPFDKVGATIGELMATAAPKGLYPRGSVSFVYLNDISTVPSEHWLTEIRIPVGEGALSQAGTLGKFTDVKKLPSVEVAVVAKPEGQADPESIYQQLYTWIFQNGYRPTEGANEVFLTNASAGDYSKMKSEIMVPIRKVSQTQ
jgi:effector-binding domain-containing protein